MKPKPLSHNDLVKLAVHKLNQGSTLNQVEKDLHKLGIERTAALKAIEEADYYVQKEKEEKELKARQESEAKEQQTQATAKETGQPQKEKSSFWIYFIVFLVLVGLALFYYYYNNKF